MTNGFEQQRQRGLVDRGSWGEAMVTPRAVMILPPSVPQDLTEARLWRLLRSEEASLTRALDE